MSRNAAPASSTKTALSIAASCVLVCLMNQAVFAQQQQQQVRPKAEQMKVMAIVNGQQITRDQLSKEAMRRFGETVTEGLVNKQLVGTECQRQGIQITEADIDQEIDRRARRFRMTVPDYVKLICSERDITVQKLRNENVWVDLALRRLASAATKVADEEIQARIQSEYGAKVQVRAIALPTAEDAQKVLAQAQANPEQFSRLAINHSVDQNSAAVGGLLPPLRRNMGEPELEQVAFSLQVGQVSNVLKMQEQFVILKCERHYPAPQMGEEDLAMAKQRIRDELREAKLGDAIASLSERMQGEAKIVNVINDPNLSKQMPGVIATVNGQPITTKSVEEQCLASFGRDVLQSEITRTLISQRLQQAGQSVNDEDLQQEMRRAAREYGITKQDGSPDLEKWIAYVTQNDSGRIEIYVQDEVWPTAAMKKVVASSVQVTEEDMQKGFESNFGERVEALAIVLQDQRTAQRVWEMAKKNQTEQFFGELAHQYSVEPASKAHYGEVPPIKKFGGRKVLEDEAFRLKPGEISGLIPLGSSWVILRCKGRTTPVVQDFDAVRDELYKDIMEKKLRIAMAEEFERLQKNSQIDNFLVGSSQPGAAQVQQARRDQQQQASPKR